MHAPLEASNSGAVDGKNEFVLESSSVVGTRDPKLKGLVGMASQDF